RQRFELRGSSELMAWSVRTRDRWGCEELLRKLRSTDVLFDGRRGLLPLAFGTLDANAEELATRGVSRCRLYALLASDRVTPRERVLDGARAALAELAAEVVQ